MTNINIEVQARTEQATRNLNNLTKTASDMGQKFNDDAAGALGVFGVSLTSLNQPLTLLANGLKDSIDYTMQWADEVKAAQKATGGSAEEASKLVITLKDFGISADTVTRAAKALRTEGLVPNIETIKTLAEKYQSFKDPAERTAWGVKTLGKSFQDLTEILEKPASQIDEVSRAAEHSGKIMSQAALDGAETFAIKSQMLTDKLDGLKIAVAGPLIDTLSAAETGLQNLVMVGGAVNIVVGKLTGAFSEDEAAARAAALASGDLAAAYTNTTSYAIALADQAERLRDDHLGLATNVSATSAATDAWSAAMMDAYPSAMDLAGATFTGLDATDKLTLGMKELTEELIFQAASEGLSSEAKLQLALSMGRVNQETIIAIDKIEALKQKYDTNRDGVIDLTESTGGYLEELKKIKDTADSIPEHQVKTVEFAITGNINGPDVGQLRTSDANANRQVLRAGGGPVSAGQPYIVGERGPEWFVPQSSGTVLPNGTAPTNNISVGAININGAGNPTATAAAVRAELERLGRTTDTRIRTR